TWFLSENTAREPAIAILRRQFLNPQFTIFGVRPSVEMRASILDWETLQGLIRDSMSFSELGRLIGVAGNTMYAWKGDVLLQPDAIARRIHALVVVEYLEAAEAARDALLVNPAMGTHLRVSALGRLKESAERLLEGEREGWLHDEQL